MKAEHYVLVFGWGGQRYENSVGPDLQTSTLGLVMIDKRSGPDAALGFNVPGGVKGYMETSHEAAAREYLEETGIHLLPEHLILFHRMQYPNGVKLDSFCTNLVHSEILDIRQQTDVGDDLFVQRFWVMGALGMSPIRPVQPAGRWAKGMSYLVPMSHSALYNPDLRPVF